jgi:hypothetical protein
MNSEIRRFVAASLQVSRYVIGPGCRHFLNGVLSGEGVLLAEATVASQRAPTTCSMASWSRWAKPQPRFPAAPTS